MNQDDLLERGHQIKLTTQIYSEAKEVLVWLGSDPDDDGKPAFESAESLATDPLSGENFARDVHGGVTIRLFSKIRRCPWFYRMWTIQERGLAKSATLIWGSSRTSWAHLTRAFLTIERILSQDLLGVWGLNVGRVTTLYQWRSPTTRQTFLELLYMSTKQQTSDSRDRVFALLGHSAAQRQRAAGDPVELLVEADYTMSEVEVYTELATNIITSTKRLDMLSYKRQDAMPYHRYHDTGLSSWVPYWTLSSNSHTYGTPDGLLKSHHDFHAAGKRALCRWTGTVTGPNSTDQYTVPGSPKKQLQIKALVLGNVADIYLEITNTRPED
jgi:hypothetical protein